MKKQRFHSLKFLLLTALFCASFAHATENISYDTKLTGIKGEELTNASKQLEIERDSYGKTLSTATIKEIYLKGPDIIKQALAPFGYFKPTINPQLSQEGNHWTASFDIDQGPALLIRSINLTFTGEGKDNPEVTKITKHIPIAIGKRFTTARYDLIKELVFNAMHNQGYINATMTQHKANINLEGYYVDINLTIDTGEQYFFGQFSFEEDKYDPAFLKKFVPFAAGQVYSPIELQKLQNTLTDTKYFSAVNVTPEVNEAQDNAIPVNIKTEAVPSQVYNFGVGYGTNTGMRTSIGTQFNRITDTGQHMATVLNLSEVNTSLLTQYYIPGPDPTRNQYIISGLIQEFEPSGGDSFARSLAPGYMTEIGHDITIHSTLNYLHERYSIESSPYDTADMIYPEFNITQKVSDDPVNPTSGYLVGLQLRGSYEFTPTSFHQEEITTKWLHKTSSNNLVMFRGNLGTTNAENFDQLPMTLRYFAGGVNTVRGYGAQSLGPGKYLKIASLEFQQRLKEQFYGAIYLDTGNATDNFHESLKKGRGAGIVWHSPIGQVALYVTQAYTEEDEPLRVDISIGAGL